MRALSGRAKRPGAARILAVLWIAAFAACAAAAEPLLAIVPLAKAARAPQALVAPTAVRIDRDAIAAAQPGSELEVPLPAAAPITLRIERIERHANGDISWSGRVLDPQRDDLLASGTTGAAGTYAELPTPERTWGIVPGGGEHDWLFDKSASERNVIRVGPGDDARIPPAHPVPMRPKATCPSVSAMPSPQATIDVLVLEAPDFIATQGGAAGAQTRLNYVFSTMNAYLAASNVAITYRRVATLAVDYPAASTPGDDDGVALDALTSGAGAFANVAALRDFYGADMVALFRGPKQSSGGSVGISGMGWINGDVNGGISSYDASHMYSVIGDWTFPDATLPAHEMGHNLGDNHDRPNASPTPSGSAPYAYGHYVCGAGAAASCGQPGFNDTGTGFGTIMAYELPTVARFSNPNLMCQGTKPGALRLPCGVDRQQDDVRAMNCVRQSVAALRPSWVGTCRDLASDGDRDGIPDCLEAASRRIQGVRDNDVFSSPLLFVAQQYRDFLRREADPGGLDHWMGEIARGTTTRAQLAAAYLESAEFQGRIAPVARLYFAYFLRIPDYDGLQYWIGQFAAGTPLDAISRQFAASQEFRNRYGALANAQFVALVYRNVLGREPDAAGLGYWTGQLDTGAIDRGALMTRFSESPEYLGIIGHPVYVTMTYMGMLRRTPDAGGFDYWVRSMDGGQAGTALVASFLASPEYRNRFLG